jgi:hypothetical protein
MGKRTTIESDQQPTGKEIRVPADQTIKTFTSTYDSVKETIDDANDALTDSADVAKKKHLNLKAYKFMKGLADGFHNAKNQAIAAEKLAVVLANLDKLRKYFKLDHHANLQGRMFAEGEIGSEPPRETDEDGEPDLRPSHLRQPDASAASVAPKSNPVADLAAKAGATPRADEDPLKQVGRGDPKLN